MSRKIKATEIAQLTAKIISLINEYGFDDETLSSVATFESDPEFRAQLLDKLCAAIGEFIDLLAQPDTNEFGYKHNTSVRIDGINHKIEKIISELELIGRSTSDDKSEKRQKRFNFLRLADTIELCKQLFSVMCNYLNGGDRGDDQHSSPLVVTAGGGNLITIFAQFLDNIATSATKKSIIKPFMTMLNNLAKITKIKIDDLIKQIKDEITANPTFKEIITEIANGPRSDLDFKLAPNKQSDRPAHGTTSRSKKTWKELQFILARLKVSRLCNIANLTREQQTVFKERRIAYEKTLKSSCYRIANTYKDRLAGKFDNTILKNLYTGQMKNEYLKLIKELRDEKLQAKPQSRGSKKKTIDHIDNCYKYLLQLSLRKEYNDRATRHNVDVISSMSANRSKQSISRSKQPKSKLREEDTVHSVRKDKQIQDKQSQDEKHRDRSRSPKSGSPKSSSESESPKSDSSFKEEQLDKSWSRIEALTLIEKIRTYTKQTNKFIEERMKGSPGITTQIIDECFETMSSLMKAHGGLIINLISAIIVNFITEPKFRTADILKAIQLSYDGKSLLEQSKVAPPSYTETDESETAPNYDSFFNPIKSQFERIISDTPYNKGLKILLMALDHIDYSSKQFDSTQNPEKYTDDQIDAILSVLGEYDDHDDIPQLTETEIDAIMAELDADKTIIPTKYTQAQIDAALLEITKEQSKAKKAKHEAIENAFDKIMTKPSGGSKKNNMIKKKTVKKKKTRTIATLKHKKYKK